MYCNCLILFRRKIERKKEKKIVIQMLFMVIVFDVFLFVFAPECSAHRLVCPQRSQLGLLSQGHFRLGYDWLLSVTRPLYSFHPSLTPYILCTDRPALNCSLLNTKYPMFVLMLASNFLKMEPFLSSCVFLPSYMFFSLFNKKEMSWLRARCFHPDIRPLFCNGMMARDLICLVRMGQLYAGKIYKGQILIHRH